MAVSAIFYRPEGSGYAEVARIVSGRAVISDFDNLDALPKQDLLSLVFALAKPGEVRAPKHPSYVASILELRAKFPHLDCLPED